MCSRIRSTPSSKRPGARLLVTGRASAGSSTATPGGTGALMAVAIASSRATASS
jgi:hypothetical protein